MLFNYIMSAASGLAAAKRRRGQSGGPSGGSSGGSSGGPRGGSYVSGSPLINEQNTENYESTYTNYQQPTTPMGILTQHHIRLREIEEEVRNNKDIYLTKFHEIEQRFLDVDVSKELKELKELKDPNEPNEDVIIFNKQITKFEMSLGTIESSVKEINKFILELKNQSESESESEKANSDTESEEKEIITGPTFGS